MESFFLAIAGGKLLKLCSVEYKHTLPLGSSSNDTRSSFFTDMVSLLFLKYFSLKAGHLLG